MITVVTGWSPDGWAGYAKTCMERLDRFWSEDIAVVAYVEECVSVPRGDLRSLWACNGAVEFFARHGNSRKARGLEPHERWTPKDRVAGYGWRWDVVKWFRQAMIPDHAAQFLEDGEILVWLDADVLTQREIPAGFIEGLMQGVDLAYVGRDTKHSDIAFIGVRLCDWTRQLLFEYAELYRSDEVFNLTEWHSAWAFDHVRRQRAPVGRFRDLSPGSTRGWEASPLFAYADHLKGPRKRVAAQRSGKAA